MLQLWCYLFHRKHWVRIRFDQRSYWVTYYYRCLRCGRQQVLFINRPDR